jgi:hypothetical protein
MAVGRGSLHHDLYVAPDSLSEDEWGVLARALAWATQAQHLLARSRMVLGDPGRDEVYGYVARRGGTAVATACLRNPADRRQTVAVDWAALFGRPGGRPVLDVRYGPPPDDAGTVTLDPFGVLVLSGWVEPA